MTANKGVTWDLSSFYPAFGGPEMEAAKKQAAEGVAALNSAAGGLGTLSAANAAAWERIITDAEDLMVRTSHLGSYIGCLSAGDAANDAYAKERAALARLGAEFGKFDAVLLRAFRDVSDADFAAFAARDRLKDLSYLLGRTRERARYTMSLEQEKLAADLGVDGFHAWGRLYSQVTGKMEFEWTRPGGKPERTPISQWRALMSDVDREVGRAAFEGGNRAWAGIEDLCASALNAIAGTRITLNRYRGIPHFLDQPLFQAATDRRTLDAMYTAIYENIDVARDIFRVKARAMGRKGLALFEREAPLPLSDTTLVPWEQGADVVEKSFRAVYPALGEHFRHMVDRRWIESEVRPGKQPGAFCTGSHLTREQRVYMTFNGTLGDVRTLAHEVGHAWHNQVLREKRPFLRSYPATLAETASIFGEHIYSEGMYSDPGLSPAAKLAMLDAELSSAAVLLLDITTRFEFEKSFHEEREKAELSASRLKELMVATQKKVFGDAMAEGGEDPYFWASKLHFYMTGISFYNFPYTLGFLLARSLFLMLKREGPSFLPKYEEFLRLTGSDTVEGVVKRSLGADVTTPAFWADAVRSLAEPLALYRKLLPQAGFRA